MKNMMKKIKILSLLVCLIALFTACHDEEDKTDYGSRTVLVYIAGDNSLSRFASEDLNEMIEGMQSVDDNRNNLLVYMDKGSNPKLIRLRKDKDVVVQDVIATYDAQNSVDVDVMKNVFTTAFSHYPADSYGVVFWSHGDGWLPYNNPSTRWWGQDTGNGDNRMNIPDLNEALSVAPHFDFILFDACYMQSVEVVYQLRNRADYFIGSPTEIPGPGAPYEVVVPALFAVNSPAVSIAENYYSVYAKKYNSTGAGISNENWTGGVSISVIKSSELSALAVATRDVLQTAVSMQQSHDIDISSILCYDPLRENNYHDLMGRCSQYKETHKLLIITKKCIRMLLYGKILQIIIIVHIHRAMVRWFLWMDLKESLLIYCVKIILARRNIIVNLWNGILLPIGILLIGSSKVGDI